MVFHRRVVIRNLPFGKFRPLSEEILYPNDLSPQVDKPLFYLGNFFNCSISGRYSVLVCDVAHGHSAST